MCLSVRARSHRLCYCHPCCLCDLRPNFGDVKNPTFLVGKPSNMQRMFNDFHIFSYIFIDYLMRKPPFLTPCLFIICTFVQWLSKEGLDEKTLSHWTKRFIKGSLDEKTNSSHQKMMVSNRNLSFQESNQLGSFNQGSDENRKNIFETTIYSKSVKSLGFTKTAGWAAKYPPYFNDGEIHIFNQSFDAPPLKPASYC